MKKVKKYISVALTIAIIICISGINAGSAENTHRVYLGGQPFGVKLYTNGVIVVKLESFYSDEDYTCPAEKAGIKVNDIIKKINGNDILSNEHLQGTIMSCKGNILKTEVERNGKTLTLDVFPEKNKSGNLLIGAWVRDSCAGIGTITYIDTEKGYFTALGHGICDCDTKALLPLAGGEVMKAKVSGINKSKHGNIGSINGYFTDEKLGSLYKNSQIGVFGNTQCQDISDCKEIELAQEGIIHKGKAKLYTCIDKETKGYDIEIERICNTNKSSNENFIICVTDQSLLDKCGGIVQGMSGSPIVQDNKIVGALTHVFVNSPEKGYGILIDNMVTISDR